MWTYVQEYYASPIATCRQEESAILAQSSFPAPQVLNPAVASRSFERGILRWFREANAVYQR